MMIWKEYLTSSILYSCIIILCLLLPYKSNAQSKTVTKIPYYQTNAHQNYYNNLLLQPGKEIEINPKSVMRRSLIIPGWGQITNKEIWKVPIIYAVYGGLAYYSVHLTKEYHQYRAAYYNSFPENDDFRFGQTQAHLQGSSSAFLKSKRNELKNTRDIIYVSLAIAHLLNAVDAYVFAHLRTFDVSDDLSLNAKLEPGTIYNSLYGNMPGVTFTLELKK